MRFGAHRAKENLYYNIDSNLLDFVSSHKDFGVLIDQSYDFMIMFGLLFGKLVDWLESY